MITNDKAEVTLEIEQLEERIAPAAPHATGLANAISHANGKGLQHAIEHAKHGFWNTGGDNGGDV